MAKQVPARRLVSIATAAETVDVHVRTVRRWIASGQLPAFRLGPRLVKVDVADLEQFARRIPTAG